ncbi:MAG: phosphoenolpyruvate--protein phosphotransferase [Caldilineales bacterium]|nr:phosphoenolpyruvate--protein phosphotransferase [Caldilineales bacterium]MDW8318401.1 phosphoenolpyruvate--protein phosphotransferase [Anaerolineae bacterium]
MELERRNIKLHARAANKADAIQQAGAILVANEYIKPGYVDSMLSREKVANTFLGNGIAIPHGLPKDRDLILRTGVSVLQLPHGVEWNRGETVHLVIAIAAKSDEHLGILANLTSVLSDEETARHLAHTDDPQDIVDVLTGKRAPRAAPAETLTDFPTYVDLTVRNPTGLHARPATVFATVAKEFASEVRVRHDNKVSNGKSLASLLKLGVERGGVIRVSAQGPDAAAALQALKQAVESGLGEEEAPAEEALPVYEWEAEPGEVVVPGIPASPGLAIGPLRFVKRSKYVVEATARDADVEKTHLKEAIAAARTQLLDLYAEVKARSGAGQASIFLAHAEFLDDPELLEAVNTQIEAGTSAGWAWQQAIEARVAELKTVGDPLIAGRAVDLSDVGRRVLSFLAHHIEEGPLLPKTPVILLADDLTPSDTASLDPALVLGFCTAAGGPTSHTAIIARALGIPAVVGAGPALLTQPESDMAILDGYRGQLYVSPSPKTLAAAQKAYHAVTAQREAEKLECYLPALTTDGHRVEVVANISRVEEASQAVNAGAEGVGLLRTEFLFQDRTTPPTEEEQYTAYREMLQALNGLPLIIRTLDIGGDKPVPYLNMPAETNPFLGVRGIRLCLARPELFRTQLRAIYRAAQHGPVRIMFPMVATLEELEAAKAHAAEARWEVSGPSVEIGIMVEVPSAVILADQLAEEVDFFSIGTNDLTQYVLAMDRGHPMLGKQADGLHPAVLRMVERTVQAASAAGKWVGVCGGIAGDPKGAVLLVGLGVAELSVSIPAIAAIKAQLRRVSLARAKSLAQQALQCRTAAEVRSLPIA